jgi:hypothetical protein
MTKEEKKQLSEWMETAMKLLGETKAALNAVQMNEDKLWNKVKYLEQELVEIKKQVKTLSHEQGRIYVS